MIVGTRGSMLALRQTDIALSSLGLDAEVVEIKTRGDKSSRKLSELGGRAFTRELDEALITGEIDLTVHSLKDIPVEDFPKELEIAGIFERADVRDCLVSDCESLNHLPEGAIVGASSERRKFELLNIRPDLKVKPLRGNVPTRIAKMDDGIYDAIITAKCALDRLGLSGRACQVFSVSEMVPAAGQGALAIVKRRDFDFSVSGVFRNLFESCMLERFFIEGLGACRKPVGAYCNGVDGLSLIGLVYRQDVRLFTEFNGDSQKIRDEVASWKAGYT